MIVMIQPHLQFLSISPRSATASFKLIDNSTSVASNFEATRCWKGDRKLKLEGRLIQDILTMFVCALVNDLVLREYEFFDVVK